MPKACVYHKLGGIKVTAEQNKEQDRIMRALNRVASVFFASIAFGFVTAGIQCGGIGFTGSTQCEPGAECVVMDETFSICLPTVTIVPIGSACGGSSNAECEAGSSCEVIDLRTLVFRCVPLSSLSPTSTTVQPTRSSVYQSVVNSPTSLTTTTSSIDTTITGSSVITSSPAVQLSVSYGRQCGGKYYKGPKSCGNQNKCNYIDDSISVCGLVENMIVTESYCGGAPYYNSGCWVGGICVTMDETFAICLPDDGYIAKHNEQCGGKNFTKTVSCERGTTCVVQSEDLSICVPTVSERVALGYQCDGEFYVGSKFCENGLECTRKKYSVSVCLPKGYVPSPIPSPLIMPATSPREPGEGIARIGDQCGGIGFTGPIICEASSTCVVMDPTFSICLPDEYYSPLNQCGAENFARCADGWSCVTISEELSMCFPDGYFNSSTKIPPPSTTVKETGIPTTESIIPKTTVRTSIKSRFPHKSPIKSQKPSPIRSPSPSPSQKCSYKWGQCGGHGWVGAKCCKSGSTCHYVNYYYSQCL